MAKFNQFHKVIPLYLLSAVASKYSQMWARNELYSGRIFRELGRVSDASTWSKFQRETNSACDLNPVVSCVPEISKIKCNERQVDLHENPRQRMIHSYKLPIALEQIESMVSKSLGKTKAN